MLDVISSLIGLLIKIIGQTESDPHEVAIQLIQAHKRAAEIDAEIDALVNASSR